MGVLGILMGILRFVHVRVRGSGRMFKGSVRGFLAWSSPKPKAVTATYSVRCQALVIGRVWWVTAERVS